MPMQPGSPQAKMPPGEDALIRRIQEIERVQREVLPSVALSIGPVVADLQAQQATLAAQQVTLAAQVAAIAAVVDAQVTGDAGNASVSGATITTSPSNQATVTIAVPVGYTRAAVLGTSSMAIGTTSLGSTMLTSIAGEDGQQMNVYPDSGNVGNGSSGHARVFAVTPGGSFQVATKAAVASGTGIVIVTTSVVVTFFRS